MLADAMRSLVGRPGSEGAGDADEPPVLIPRGPRRRAEGDAGQEEWNEFLDEVPEDPAPCDGAGTAPPQGRVRSVFEPGGPGPVGSGTFVGFAGQLRDRPRPRARAPLPARGPGEREAAVRIAAACAAVLALALAAALLACGRMA